jgi:hypothetical protein
MNYNSSKSTMTDNTAEKHTVKAHERRPVELILKGIDEIESVEHRGVASQPRGIGIVQHLFSIDIKTDDTLEELFEQYNLRELEAEPPNKLLHYQDRYK